MYGKIIRVVVGATNKHKLETCVSTLLQSSLLFSGEGCVVAIYLAVFMTPARALATTNRQPDLCAHWANRETIGNVQCA
jgi:hypothetical protein